MTQLKTMIENIINENFDNAKVNFHSYITGKIKSNITEDKKDFSEGQTVILNPAINGTSGKVGTVVDVYDQNVTVKNYTTGKTHSFSKSDVYDVDSPEAEKLIDDETEDLLDKLWK